MDNLTNLNESLVKTYKYSKPKLKDTIGILKLIRDLFGKNQKVRRILLSLVLYSVVFWGTILGWFVVMFTIKNPNLILVLLLVIVFLGFYGVFFYAKQRALAVCEASKEVIKEELKNGIGCRDLVAKYSSDIKMVGMIDLINGFLGATKAQGGERGGLGAALRQLLIGILSEGLDLFSNFAIPSIIISNKNIKGALNDLKELQKNLPATLVGVLGIDFIGNSIRGALFFLYFVVLAIFIGLSYLGGMWLEDNNLVINLGDNANFYLPMLFIGIAIVILINALVKPLVAFLKSIYFGLLYLSLKKPEDIKQEYKKDLTNYLLQPVMKA